MDVSRCRGIRTVCVEACKDVACRSAIDIDPQHAQSLEEFVGVEQAGAVRVELVEDSAHSRGNLHLFAVDSKGCEGKHSNTTAHHPVVKPPAAASRQCLTLQLTQQGWGNYQELSCSLSTVKRTNRFKGALQLRINRYG